MVVIKGGGTTYQISSGKQMPWEDVPEQFKRLVSEQKEIESCVSMRALAQKCIEDKGFWEPQCVEMTEKFHLCQANELRAQLPPRKVTDE
mmetsp:Transcript_70563/g.82213  ORF Transcript_70563/g.82213 Transcript_70563/m.82213 type:complete len:90 (+) Transcript_70563:147-416(+)